MLTWVLVLNLLVPSTPLTLSATAGATAEAETGLRHRGVERLFAKFDREAKATDRLRR